MSSRTTLVGAPVVVAPGKVFLGGEYAVLEGSPAIVAAVSRNAVAQYVPGLRPESRVVDEAVRLSTEHLGELAHALPAGSVMVNSEEFAEKGRKLGLGSSAAAAVSTVGAVFEYCGYDIALHRHEVFVLADEAHRTAQQGVGSGADVAAAVHGSVMRFQRPPNAPPTFETLPPMAGLEIVVFATEKSASTPDLVRMVRGLVKKQPELYKWLMEELTAAAFHFAEAFTAANPRAVITAARSSHEALTALGRAANLPIVTDEVALAAHLAQDLGGAAKISGAGGGDVGVAFFAGVDAARQFADVCPAGVSVLDLQIELKGVHRRRAAGFVDLGIPHKL